MSASIGTPVEPAGVLRDPAPVHEHVWGLMRFELVDDRPLVRQEVPGLRVRPRLSRVGALLDAGRG